MFGLSMGEIVIIAILALLLLGPDRLPDAAKMFGKTMRDLRKATDDIKDQVEREIYTDEKKPVARPSLVPPVPAAPPVPGPAGPPPPASTENVPGLEAALAEPPSTEPFFVEPPPEPPAAPEPSATEPSATAAPAAAPPATAAPSSADAGKVP